MDKATFGDLVERFVDAFNREDLDGVMEFFAEDSVYDQFNGERAEGKKAIREAFAPQFHRAFGFMQFVHEDTFLDVEAGKAMTSWTCTMESGGTESGGMKGDGMESHGEAHGWRGLDLLYFRDGKLVEKHTYAKAEIPLLKPTSDDAI